MFVCKCVYMHQVCARERRHVHFKMVEDSRLLESAFGMQEHRSWEFRWLVYLSIYVCPLRGYECACVCAHSVRVHVRGWPQKPLIWSAVLIVRDMGLSLAWGLAIRLISEPKGSTCLHITNAGITNTCQHTWIAYMGLGDPNQAPMFAWQALHWLDC